MLKLVYKITGRQGSPSVMSQLTGDVHLLYMHWPESVNSTGLGQLPLDSKLYNKLLTMASSQDKKSSQVCNQKLFRFLEWKLCIFRYIQAANETIIGPLPREKAASSNVSWILDLDADQDARLQWKESTRCDVVIACGKEEEASGWCSPRCCLGNKSSVWSWEEERSENMRVDFDSLLYTHKHTGLVNHNFISIKGWQHICKLMTSLWK